MRTWPIAAILFAAAHLSTGPADAAGTLRFALDFDFETFDPARSGSYIERVVNTGRPRRRSAKISVCARPSPNPSIERA